MDLPLHRCSSCSRLVAGRCDFCERARGTSNARGYNSARWLRFRAVQLSRSPLCALCEVAGRVTIADCVDHIRPVRGPLDARFLDFRAVQSLCTSCHSRKTRVENGTTTLTRRA